MVTAHNSVFAVRNAAKCLLLYISLRESANPCHSNRTVARIEPHDPNTLGISPLHPDIAHRNPDDVSVLAGDEEFVVLVDRLDRNPKPVS